MRKEKLVTMKQVEKATNFNVNVKVKPIPKPNIKKKLL